MFDLWAPWPQNPKILAHPSGYIKGFRGRESIGGIDVSSGYRKVYIGGGKSSQKHQYVHRIIAETFLPNPEGKPYVNHIDSNRANNVIWNLEWVTAQENTLHGAAKGHFRGAKPEYGFEEAQEWLNRHKNGESFRAIGRSLGIMHNTVINTIRREGLMD